MAKRRHCEISGSVQAWRTNSRKEQSYSLPEIGEFLRDEWSHKRKDAKPFQSRPRHVPFVLPKRESTLNSEFQFYGSVAMQDEVSLMNNQMHSQSENSNSSLSVCETNVTKVQEIQSESSIPNQTVFANSSEIYSTPERNGKVSHQTPNKQTTMKYRKVFCEKPKGPIGSENTIKEFPRNCPKSNVPPCYHEYQINRQCSFSELLNEGLLSQAVDTLSEPLPPTERVWETKRNCCQFESVCDPIDEETNAAHSYSITESPLCKKESTSNLYISDCSSFICDSRFTNLDDTFPNCNYDVCHTKQIIQSTPLTSNISNTISRPLESNCEATADNWRNSKNDRHRTDLNINGLKKIDNHTVLDNSAAESSSICNYLFEDIDLSAVDKNCMEQLEKEYQNEAVKEVEFACSLLNLDKDPRKWNANQVQKWVMWTVHQCRLSSVDVTAFSMSGENFCSMSEKMMRSLAPLCGDILHARLDVWRSVAKLYGSDEKLCCLPDVKSNVPHKSDGNTEKDTHAESNGNLVEAMTPNHTSGIHLWQFLKELLLQPDRYGRYIRWIDREQGVFKIEDSVEVARLWGVRKNRPAMNYDKLSRSIRQYYKKGIIRKTEISQRLVYQFVKKIT